MKKKIPAVLMAFAITAGLMPCAYALADGVPSSVEAATLNKVEVLKDEDGVPYFQLEVQFPQSFINLSEERPDDGDTWIDYYWKIDSGSWEYLGGGSTDCLIDESYGCAVPGKTNTYNVSNIYPENESNDQAILIKDHTYTLRVQLGYQYRDISSDEDLRNPFKFVYSAFSNEISIGSGSFYKKVSDWAKPELQNAYDLGLIPDILVGADMTKPITREEFCELAVLLYEKVTGSSSEPVAPNPFTDTTNAQILKAFKLGITTGTTATTFSPNVRINREQCATMLFRAIKVMKPKANFSTAGIKDFADQSSISSWAVQATKYMFKMGIIAGSADGNFKPKATTTAQEASGYGMATREQAIALSIRTYEKVPSIS